MKLALLIILLFTVDSACGQTDNHIKVNGTKCRLVPAKGFVPVTNFSGFQNVEKSASIMINEVPAPYQTVVESFTADALRARGMNLLDKQVIDFNSAKATFINVTQLANGVVYRKQMLVFGDANKTVLVNGIYPDELKELETDIKTALLSTIYDSDQNDNPLTIVPFEIDIKNTDFKFVKYMSGSLLYSTDGKIPTNAPLLTVSNSISKVNPENRKTFAEDRVKKLPDGASLSIKQTNEIIIDNLKGFETIAERKSSSALTEVVYQVMLFDGNGNYFLIIGQAREDFEDNLKSYKDIAKTFKRK